MLKNKAYWSVYNQKRKDYLTLKKRESRERAKSVLSATSPWSTTSQEGLRVVDRVVDTLPVVDQQDDQVVDMTKVVDQASKVVDQKCPLVVDNNPKQVVDHSILTQLIQSWKTRTNYSCPSTCAYSYCNNCWYFYQNELIDYKEVSV